MSTSNSTTQETAEDKVSVSKTMNEVNKDTSVKAVEDKKIPIVDAEDAIPSVEHNSKNKSEVYTAEKPMTMKFRKANIWINSAQANAPMSK